PPCFSRSAGTRSLPLLLSLTHARSFGVRWLNIIRTRNERTCQGPRRARLRRRGWMPNVERLEDRLVPAVGEIHGTVWNDVNGNGVLDSGEPGVADRAVFLDQN